jgi:hypothetical protein
MAIDVGRSRILKLDDDRCLIVPPGGWFDRDAGGVIVRWSADSRVTFRGYVDDGRPPWPGAVPERVHPWPFDPTGEAP